METRGYTLRADNPVDIHELSPGVYTFSVKKDDIGKFLEIDCLHNTIISACGKNHPGGYSDSYSINIRCMDNDDKEPFQEFHQCSILTKDRHIVSDIIVTKILQKEINQNDKNIQEWSKLANPILKIIGSKDPCEYPMWTGNYKLFHKEFLNDSFNLYANEKIIFYIIKPNIDIVKVKFNMKVDILEIKIPEELTVLNKDKITDMTSSDYKSVITI